MTTPCLLLLLSLLISLGLLYQLLQHSFFKFVLPSTSFFPYPSMFWQSKSCLRSFMGRGVINDGLGRKWKIKIVSPFNFRTTSACTRDNLGKSSTTCSICYRYLRREWNRGALNTKIADRYTETLAVFVVPSRFLQFWIPYSTKMQTSTQYKMQKKHTLKQCAEEVIYSGLTRGKKQQFKEKFIKRSTVIHIPIEILLR
jgi:hypothetical protein